MQRPLFRTKSASTYLTLAFSFLLALTFLLAVALPPTSKAIQEKAGGEATKKALRPEFVAGQALVRYRSERIAKRQSVQTLTTADGRELTIQLERFDGADIVPGLRLARMAAADTMAAIEALKKQPDVLYAEPDYLLQLDLTPNDPRFTSGELYGLTKIGAPSAWDTTTGSTGSNRIVVGVIDEGIDKSHTDLGTNIWTNPAEIAGNGIDDDGNGFIDDINGYNFPGNTGTIPAETHATHVAGTIGALGNNGTGVVGVNWQVGLMSLKFIGGSTGATSDAIRASNYAKMMRDLWVSTGGVKGANIRVLNNSYGGGGFSQSFLDAINSLNTAGILFVAAAGNAPDSPEPNNDLVPHYPGSYDVPNVISVAATDSGDGLASFSHYGATSVHIGAPGVGILSTTPSNSYSFLNGTSMATPHVAGAAALLLAANPSLTVTQLKSLLLFNGDPVASLANKTTTGRRLSVANSMLALNGNDVTPPGTPTSFHLNSQNGRTLNVGWTDSGDDGAVGQASLYELSFTDATSGAVIVLKRISPAASGNNEAFTVKLPYRHTSGTLKLREFDNSGNEGVPATLSVSVGLIDGDPYITSLGSSAALSTGGTPLSLVGDDKLKLNYALPFTFQFFNENFTTVNISTNGNLYFSAPPTRANGDADDVPSSLLGLSKYKMISGLWDDLRTDSEAGASGCGGCDVYAVIPDSTRIIFRWQGVTFGDGTPSTEYPVNFEIELRNNGTVLTRYGTGQSAPINTNLLPVVGISGGETDPYDIPSHTSKDVFKSLTNAQEVTFTPRGAHLTIASVNPASGVNITVTPADTSGLGNGTTSFVRGYESGTVVNLTAPAIAGGNNFLKWQRDGVDWAVTPATSITTDTINRTMTAVYVNPRTLTIASVNPSTGVNITVTPADNDGNGNGTTPFPRHYGDGTVVNLTAPATAGGNNFLKWQRDGVDWAVTPATSVTIDANRTMTAVYITPHTLSIASTNPASGTNITVTPADNNGAGNGATPFARIYNEGKAVNLTAPASSGLNNFLKWQRDGVDYAVTAATSVTVDANHTMTAIYVPTPTLTVASVNPASAVIITVTPNDNSGQGSGPTPFARTYDKGTVINLTAPATASGNNFLKWQRDGVDYAVTAATSVTLDANRTMSAVYITPHTLTIASVEPSSGVNITVTPTDNGGLSSGTTQFGRVYNDGTVVNLTAPSNANGNPFVKWQRDGADYAVTPATSVTVDANHTMTAVFNPSVNFTLSHFSMTEADLACTNPGCGASVTIAVSRNGPTTSPASVDYTTSDDVATQKGDYIISAGKLNFAAGESGKSFTVFIVDDVYQEGTESFKVVLSNPVGIILGTRSVADVSITDNDSSVPTTNPLDNSDARFFVREHYVDFLNREPDAGGLNFWTDQITSCGTDTSCTEVRRINVSAAFFLSIEFQETGYLVERLYKSSYGDATGTSTFGGTHQLAVPMVRYAEFMADSQAISRGVVIGQPGADQLLENNKQAFIAAFVQRSRFTAAFATSLTPAQFVDALFANAGITPAAVDRTAAINEFGGGGSTADTAARARALRLVAENPALSSAEKNKAFVLMQYFGYLRRDPNVGVGPNPDVDYTGYDFWLTKLLQFNGNFVESEMVKAFIVSAEYRQRFGP